MYYLLECYQDIARTHTRTRSRLRARCVNAHKANSLMQSQLGYYIYGNRSAVLLYRTYSMRIVLEYGA